MLFKNVVACPRRNITVLQERVLLHTFVTRIIALILHFDYKFQKKKNKYFVNQF